MHLLYFFFTLRIHIKKIIIDLQFATVNPDFINIIFVQMENNNPAEVPAPTEESQARRGRPRKAKVNILKNVNKFTNAVLSFEGQPFIDLKSLESVVQKLKCSSFKLELTNNSGYTVIYTKNVS